jgi:hypothetical protein
MKEHRKSGRFTLKLPAKIEMEISGQENRIFDLHTSNICVGGAFFPTTQPITEGARVKIDLLLSFNNKLKTILDKLKLDDQAHIKVKGTVVRSESVGMAVRFDEDYQIIPLQSLSNSGSNP